MASQDIAKMTQSEVFDQKGVAYIFFHFLADDRGQSEDIGFPADN
jgi:hypothetical protein